MPRSPSGTLKPATNQLEARPEPAGFVRSGVDPSCVFCAIVAGKAPAHWAANVDGAAAIVPLNPVTPGHLLFLPKVHVRDAFEDPAITSKVMEAACRYAAQEAANIITSVGSAATQTVFHLHIHVVPRKPGDGLALPWTGQR